MTATDFGQPDTWTREHLWPDDGWLKIYGYESLADWQSKEGNPAKH